MKINKEILKSADKILAERKIEEEKENELWEYICRCIKADICPECGGKVELIPRFNGIYKCLACGFITEIPHDKIRI